MRRLPAILIAAAVAAPLVVAVPGMRLGAAAPRPVATTVRQLPLWAQVRPPGRPPTGLLAEQAARELAVVGSGGRPFQTVGVTWDASAAVPDVVVRVRTRGTAPGQGAPGQGAPGNGSPGQVAPGQGWSGWRVLEPQDGDGPGERGGTEPAYVGPSDAVEADLQVRSGLAPTGVRVELVDPGTSSYDARAGQEPGDAALAATGRPAVLSRAQWGADERRVRQAPSYNSTVRAVVLHHTADRNDYTVAQVPAMIRGDFAYHLSRGWNDIGYNFLVDRFGRTWEGRGGGVDLPVLGAHAGGFNTDTMGTALLGNYDSATPSAAALGALARLFAWKLDLYHRDPLGSTPLTSSGGGTSRYPAGRVVRVPVVMGHREVGQTACPGAHMYARMPALRTAVQTTMGAVLAEPSGLPAALRYGAVDVRQTARALAAQSWRLDVTRLCPRAPAAAVAGRSRARQVITATWNGRGPGTALARPGQYAWHLSSAGARGPARPVDARITVLPPAVPAARDTGVIAGPGNLVPLTPRRLLDTRSGPVLPAGPGARADLPVLGRAGVPASGVTSVVLSVTATCATAETAVEAWPTGRPQPGTAQLFLPAGGTGTALVAVPVGTGGQVSLATRAGIADLVVDVTGYYTTVGTTGAGSAAAAAAAAATAGSATTAATAATAGPSGLVPVTPRRAYDLAADPRGALRAGVDRGVATGADPAASAVLAVVSAPRPVRDGSLVLAAAGAPTPTVTSLTFHAGQPASALVLLALGADGTAVLRSSADLGQLSLDVIAELRPLAVDPAGTAFTAVPGARLLDTRGGRIPAAGQQLALPVAGRGGVPADATAVLLNLVAVRPAAATALSAWPAGGTAPAAGAAPVGALRVPAGRITAGALVVPLGVGGALTLRGSGASHLLAEVLGYYR